MKSKTNLYFVIISVIVFLTIYLTKPDKKTSNNEDKEALALLFLGKTDSNTTSKNKNQNTDKSIYDSNFWKDGVKNIPIEDSKTQSEEDPDILEKVSEGNPINPQTGLPYTDEQMEQFDKLRQKFPNNSLIPKRTTPEEVKAQEEKQRRILEIQSKISSRKATTDEIQQYFDYQKKPIQDRIELLQYVLDALADELPDDLRGQYTEVLKMNEKQIQSIEEQKQTMLKSAVQ